MGNKLGRRKQIVDDKFTRPQGLYQQRDVDQKKLRKLILDSKLAPCYPGKEETHFDFEECPICFLYYPSLNRSRCCMKGICTECFLQMKPPHSTRPTQCPFCKTSNYAVEYRGVLTKEEKGKEQVEEQKVIEAKIRMQQQERLDEEEKMQKRQAAYSSSRTISPGEVEFHEIPCNSVSVSSYKNSVQNGEFASSSSSQSTSVLQTRMRSPHLFRSREDEFDLDLEEIMVMEAIWLSIQEQGCNKNGGSSPYLLSSEDHSVSHSLVPCESSSSGLACAVATLAEHQHHANMDLASSSEASAASFDMLPTSSHLPSEDERLMINYPPEICFEVSSGSERAMCKEGDWAIDRGSELAEIGASYTASDVAVDRGLDMPFQDGGGGPSGRFIPDTYEEQVVLAMTVSLAEARARTNTHEMTWM